ncbi:hypothetical protein [Shewanella nanhaiensis]|uniref:PNPLA domain-containing protein n=1 Tax=Shewanella nanhaiensis TaxID=2864872 RepID=A0ABS7E9P5_9GAMM|nr:hypothetical protein [Shewanella nanhaiensis]MBW8186335.1 hypothetical protein [Shewanella nanhaiensis]
MTKQLKAVTYRMTNTSPYPETTLASFNTRSKDKEVGITFSGGGTRSACCTLGQLKALHDSGLINKVKYISSVSGGAWAAIPYTFISEIQLERFWGEILPPEDITLEKIESPAPLHSLQYSITHSAVVGRLIKAGFKGYGDESFAHVLSQVFLKPFKLDSADQSFSFDNASVESACAINPQTLTPEDFVTSREGSPFLIVGATLQNPDGVNFNQSYPVEYTPLYSGIKQHFLDDDWFNADDNFGGGYIDSYGYDCIGPYKIVTQGDKTIFSVKRAPKKGLDFTNERAFSLADIMASTGAAPQEVTEFLGLKSLGFPEFNHIPIHTAKGTERLVEEYSHSDGGHSENLGIMPLLARGVKRIYVFINTKKAFKPDKKLSKPDRAASKKIAKTDLNRSVKALFVPLKNWHKLSNFSDNLVFKGGEAPLLELIELLAEKVDSKANGIPAKQALFATQKLTTIANHKFGVKGDQDVEITWVYNQRSQGFENTLKDKRLKEHLKEQDQDDWDPHGLDNFPHYETFMENSGVIKLTPLQTNLLVSHSHWVASKAIASS